jgi:general secretion pathway protein J
MKRLRGFTLIELIVAMLITAIVFTLGYGTLNQAVGNRETISANAARLQALQSTVHNLVQDFSQLVPRPVRDPLGEGQLPALLGEATRATLTRGGWMNPAGVPRSTQQRVRYLLEDGKLYREQWSVLDATLDPPPTRRLLLEHVRAFSLRYLSEDRDWRNDWPPQLQQFQQMPQMQGNQRPEKELRWRPLAVEITIDSEDFGKVMRLIEVPG